MSSPVESAPVIVAGGGIGGLAAAIALRTAGCRITVLEKAAQFAEIGAGIQLGPNAFHALGTLGVADAALKHAVYIDRLVMMDGVTGEEVAAIPLGEAFRQYFKNPYAVIHRPDLYAARQPRGYRVQSDQRTCHGPYVERCEIRRSGPRRCRRRTVPDT